MNVKENHIILIRYAIGVIPWILMGIRFKRVRLSSIIFAPYIGLLCELSFGFCMIVWHNEAINEREFDYYIKNKENKK